jgi:nitrate/TMAO reductase-like tetraheme cytochrome c subunit
MLAFWNLQMRLHIKIGLGALFGCGVAAGVCAAVKTKELSTLTATSDLTCK